MSITIIGTGYVGLVTAVCLADAGFDVVCVDKDEKKIEMLNKGTVPFYEPGLKELMTKNKNRLRFVEIFSLGISRTDIIFICVGTPPQKDGSPDMTAYWSVIDEIRVAVGSPSPLQELILSEEKEEGRGEVLVINKSTVPVGTARKAQEKLGDAFIVVSMPEFLREGKAIHDFKHPDRVVVGGDVETYCYTSLRVILDIWSCPILTMSWESAELTKYAANAFLATKISFINEIARLCEKVGANVDAVAEAIGKDPRIGEHFLKAGIGYGGSCFPKDIRALSALAGANDYEFELLKATIEVNQSQREFILNKIVEMGENLPSLHNLTIAVLGLAFKGDTDDIRESPALWLIEELIKKGMRVQCYDPQAMPNARRSLSPLQELVLSEEKEEGCGEVVFSDSPESCVKDADCIVIATEWEEFKHLDWKALKKLVKTPVIVDAKNLLDKDTMEAMGWKYKGIGRNV